LQRFRSATLPQPSQRKERAVRQAGRFALN
jgi:hypothetical protein